MKISTSSKTRLRRGIVRLVVLTLGLTGALTAFAQAGLKPLASNRIPNQIIVAFHPQTDNPRAVAEQMARQSNGQILHVYNHVLKGFAMRLPSIASATAAVSAMSSNPAVARVSTDGVVQLAAEAPLNPPLVQSGATWGLDRIDQRDLPLNSQYGYRFEGRDVYAFVVDTGVAAHTEFGDRLQAANFGGFDCHGHGTHVAGTIAGTQWGVAKRAKVVSVSVLDCGGGGSTSTVIAGLDWIAGQTTLRPGVANISLQFSRDDLLNQAVESLSSQGVPVVVAAGNWSTDACGVSPASATGAVTVGATDFSDTRASWSNFGSCVDVFAPGVDVTAAALYGGGTSMSGTSMASPHVAGVAALLLAQNPRATSAQVHDFLVNTATTNKVSSPGTASPNRLLYVAEGFVPPAPTPISVASLTTSTNTWGATNWRSHVVVRVRNNDGQAVAGATVRGEFWPSGRVSCVTGVAGTCQVTSPYLSRKKGTRMVFTVMNLSGTNMTYVPQQNSAVQVTISAP